MRYGHHQIGMKAIIALEMQWTDRCSLQDFCTDLPLYSLLRISIISSGLSLHPLSSHIRIILVIPARKNSIWYPMNLLSFSIGFQSCTLLLILRKYRFYNDVMQTLWHLIERDDTILLLKCCVQHGRSGLVDFKMEAVAGRTLFMFCGQCF